MLYVPKLCYNLLSVSTTTNNGHAARFVDNKCEIICSGKLVAVGKKVGNLYHLNCENNHVNVCNQKSTDKSEKLWHRRLCHIGFDNVRKLHNKQMVDGLDIKLDDNTIFCEQCCDGKQNRLPFPKIEKPKRDPLELIHSDVCGMINPNSYGEGKYFVTFIDDATHFTWVYILKSKDEVFCKFKEWKNQVENQFATKIKKFRSDNGGEYISNEFKVFLKREGIHHELTIPKTPQQNGVAERMNRTLLEGIRSMLSDSGLNKRFWAEALSTCVYVRNRCPTTTLVDQTPYTALYKQKPDVSHLRVFGTNCYAHIPKDERSKLDSKSQKCVFLGYCDNRKGYKLYNTHTNKIVISRDVIFNETEKICSTDENKEISFEREKIVQFESSISDSTEIEEEILTENESSRPKRNRRAPDRYGEWTSICSDSYEPKSVAEAMDSPDSEKWVEAMQKEMSSIQENHVWDLAPAPKGSNIVGSKWIFKKKIGPTGGSDFIQSSSCSSRLFTKMWRRL